MGPTATRTPGQTLREEHRLILRALELVKMGADRLDEGRPLPDGWWEQLVEWLRTFADRSHHGKEEQHLFPALIQAGVPADGGPIGVMLDEHAEGRVLIRIMAEDHGARRVAAAHAYVHLLSAHIETRRRSSWSGGGPSILTSRFGCTAPRPSSPDRASRRLGRRPGHP